MYLRAIAFLRANEDLDVGQDGQGRGHPGPVSKLFCHEGLMVGWDAHVRSTSLSVRHAENTREETLPSESATNSGFGGPYEIDRSCGRLAAASCFHEGILSREGPRGHAFRAPRRREDPGSLHGQPTSWMSSGWVGKTGPTSALSTCRRRDPREGTGRAFLRLPGHHRGGLPERQEGRQRGQHVRALAFDAKRHLRTGKNTLRILFTSAENAAVGGSTKASLPRSAYQVPRPVAASQPGPQGPVPRRLGLGSLPHGGGNPREHPRWMRAPTSASTTCTPSRSTPGESASCASPRSARSTRDGEYELSVARRPVRLPRGEACRRAQQAPGRCHREVARSSGGRTGTGSPPLRPEVSLGDAHGYARGSGCAPSSS